MKATSTTRRTRTARGSAAQRQGAVGDQSSPDGWPRPRRSSGAPTGRQHQGGHDLAQVGERSAGGGADDIGVGDGRSGSGLHRHQPYRPLRCQRLRLIDFWLGVHQRWRVRRRGLYAGAVQADADGVARAAEDDGDLRRCRGPPRRRARSSCPVREGERSASASLSGLTGEHAAGRTSWLARRESAGQRGGPAALAPVVVGEDRLATPYSQMSAPSPGGSSSSRRQAVKNVSARMSAASSGLAVRRSAYPRIGAWFAA